MSDTWAMFTHSFIQWQLEFHLLFIIWRYEIGQKWFQNLTFKFEVKRPDILSIHPILISRPLPCSYTWTKIIYTLKEWNCTNRNTKCFESKSIVKNRLAEGTIACLILFHWKRYNFHWGDRKVQKDVHTTTSSLLKDEIIFW